MGFTDVGLLSISESTRAYAYLILSSQTSARSSIVGNSASSLTAQSAFLNNFENVVNRRVDIREDVKRYQDTRYLSYALSKVNYSVDEHLYMLPSDTTLKIRPGTVGYSNKILVSDGKFSLGKNEKVKLVVPAIISHKANSLETPAIKNHKTNSLEPTIITTSQGLTHTPAISQKPKTMFLGKTDQSQIDFVLYNVLLTTPFSPLAKRHIQIPVKQQIKHDNLDVVFGHRMATGFYSLGLTLHISGYRRKTSINSIVHLFICSP